jgi:hypothetical protein
VSKRFQKSDNLEIQSVNEKASATKEKGSGTEEKDSSTTVKEHFLASLQDAPSTKSSGLKTKEHTTTAIEIPHLPQLEQKAGNDIFSNPPPGMAAFAKFIKEKEGNTKEWSDHDQAYAQAKLSFLQDQVKSQIDSIPSFGSPSLVDVNLKSLQLLLKESPDLSDTTLKLLNAKVDAHFMIRNTLQGLNLTLDIEKLKEIKQKIFKDQPLDDFVKDITDLRDNFDQRLKQYKSDIRHLDDMAAGKPDEGISVVSRHLKTKEGIDLYREVLQIYTPLMAKFSEKLNDIAKPSLSQADRKKLFGEIDTLIKTCQKQISDDSQKYNLGLKSQSDDKWFPLIVVSELLNTLKSFPQTQRLPFVKQEIQSLQTKLQKALLSQKEKEPLEKKKDVINGSRIPTNDEMLTYLKEAYAFESRKLTEPGNRVTRTEITDGNRWPDNTLIGTACSQYENESGDHYFRYLVSALRRMKTIPEAIKLVDFTTRNYHVSDRSISSCNSNDSWNMDQVRKRMVLCISGLDEQGHEGNQLMSSHLIQLRNELHHFGQIVDAERQPSEYKRALEGKYQEDLPATKSIISIRRIEECVNQEAWKKRLKDGFLEMKKFKDNNPNAEFLILISAHGGAQTDLTTEMLKKGMNREGGALGYMFEITEDQLKKKVIDSIGDSPSVIISGQCRGAAIIE